MYGGNACGTSLNVSAMKNGEERVKIVKALSAFHRLLFSFFSTILRMKSFKRVCVNLFFLF